MRALTFLALLLLAACATAQPPGDPSHVDIAPGVVLVLPDAPPFGPEATAVQLVQGRYGDRAQALQAFVESDGTRTTVVMTIPSGPRIMSVTWSAGSFVTQLEPQAPPGITGEHMLADMLLIYAPLPLLETAVVGGQVVEGGGGHRRVVKDGVTLIEITRPASGNPWNGQATLENLAHGYSLAVQSQSSQP